MTQKKKWDNIVKKNCSKGIIEEEIKIGWLEKTFHYVHCTLHPFQLLAKKAQWLKAKPFLHWERWVKTSKHTFAHYTDHLESLSPKQTKHCSRKVHVNYWNFRLSGITSNFQTSNNKDIAIWWLKRQRKSLVELFILSMKANGNSNTSLG